MFKKELYYKVVEILNLNSQGLLFDSGYHIVFYNNGIPTVIDKTSLNQFDYKKIEVVPVSESYSQETPYIDLVDRSDYVMQYQIMYRLENVDKVEIALEEYRAYMVANRQHIIDGYNVTLKVTRGDKQGSWQMSGGNYYGSYTLDVYVTASQGYLSKASDKWEIRQHDIGDYVTIKSINDQSATDYNALASNKSDKITHFITSSAFTGMFQLAYTGTDFDNLLYNQVMGKGSNSYVFDLKETFNNIVNEYVVVISNGGRTRKLNEPVFLEFNVVEFDVE